jgi:hypothetical protein
MVFDSWSGNVNGNALSSPYPETRVVSSFYLTNRAATATTVDIYMITPQQVSIAPLNMQLAAGNTYEGDEIILKYGHQLKITTSGSVDYYFSFSV